MKVSVVGLGKLGLPLAAVLAEKNYHVFGVDLNQDHVKALNQAEPLFFEPGLCELLKKNIPFLQASTRYEGFIERTDVTFIIVPTPSDENGAFSNQYLLQALQSVGRCLRPKDGYHLVVITSTVMPGSTDAELKKALETSSGRTVGDDIGLCYSPKFIALGSVIENMLHPDMVLIGESDKKAGDMLESIYLNVCGAKPTFCRMNFVNAELTKISVNTFVTTKITYANMLAEICEYLPRADVDIVTQAVGSDSRVGGKYLKGAVAFGGPCFPRDNLAFTNLAEGLGAHADLAKATHVLNQYQPQRIEKYLQKFGAKKIAILGLAYKAGTYVVDESPGILLANSLVEKGYEVSVYDPIANAAASFFLKKEIELHSSLSACVDANEVVIVMTPWPCFKEQLPPLLQNERKVLLDCWRLFHSSDVPDSADLFYLGSGNDYLAAQARQFDAAVEIS